MSLAAEHGRVTRTRISDDALHHAGLADAGFPLDDQRRRPPLAELADCGRSHGELGPTPKASPSASASVQPKASCLSLCLIHPRPPPFTGGHVIVFAQFADGGGRW